MIHLATRRAIAAAVAVAAAATLGGCGESEDTSRRRPIGQGQGTDVRRQLPDDHPEIARLPSGEMRGPGTEGGGEGQRAQRDLPEKVTVFLDSGNAAYRAGDYGGARRHFRAVVREDSTVAAGWFGVYMAERALGNESAADSALWHVRDLSDAAAMHPAPTDNDDAGNSSARGSGQRGG